MSLTQIIRENPSLKYNFPMLKPHLQDIHGNLLTPTFWKTPIKVPTIGKSFEAGLIGMTYLVTIIPNNSLISPIATKYPLSLKQRLLNLIPLKVYKTYL